MKKSINNKLFRILNTVFLLLFTIMIIIPLWNVVISSFASSTALAEGNYILFPNELSLENYRAVFSDNTIWRALFISVSKTFVGVITHVLFSALFAYPLSKRYLKGRGFYSKLGIVTMFFSGGMIPTYLLIKRLGLLNSFWVYIIPAIFSYYDVIIIMNFFRDIPISLEESAKMDGATHWTIFRKIYLPLSKPALATIALFNGVNQWNDFMTAKLYITNKSLYPLQMKLYEIIVQTQTQNMQNIGGSMVLDTTPKGVQLATIVVTALPIILVYPMLQKHFVSGMMSGAVKE